jgi:hypothetical protein
MHRVTSAAFLLMLAGCQITAERVPLMPLPEGGDPLPYTDVVQRARSQAAAANEAFYADKWNELQEATTALEKTVRYFPKAADVPDKQKANLAARVADLAKLCGQLRDAAREQDVKKTNEAMQQINLKLRELRPAN